MYIEKTFCGYDRSGQQIARRGKFLLLLQLDDKPCGASNTFAVVRKVALQQFGHFMMGKAKLAPSGQWAIVSGAYGSDGLPMTVKALPHDAKPLPQALYEALANGGGWNSAGNEAPLLRAWARESF